ncbi:hypothetical protein FIBSPDRAFT_1018418 [Athelia psychrophila]|uniref:Uncharacterized protein n=2 Tax=Athelia psychrophila TaxID=1759441 RepID=A0A166KUZ3_9AGAM|nr:hypothetical protein FIBSPDRAFT_1018418 [Fibularhizoctonia sp. CBS 109695]
MPSLILLPELLQSVGALSQPTESAAQASCIDINHCRTICNIIWSCLATIAACTWVAVHWNVPDPRSGMICVNLDRIAITICALLVPEYIIGWAVRQWLTAQQIAQTNEKLAKEARDCYRRLWTVTHGFFVIMGGFYFLDPKSTPRPLSREQVEERVENSSFELPKKSDVDDKSKADMFSKVVASLQTLWFVMQSLARPIQQLPLTKLEIATLAYTSINMVMYGFWWSKPLNVGRPVQVRHQQMSPSQPRRSQTMDTFQTAMTHQMDEYGDADVFSTSPSFSQETLVMVDHSSPSINDADSMTSWSKKIKGGSPTRMQLYIMKLACLLKTIMGAQDNEVDLLKLSKVPNFYAGVPIDVHIIWADFIALIFAMVFGAVHCAAWSLMFPSQAEKLMWRAASMALVGIPAIYILVVTLYMFEKQRLVKYLLLLSLITIPFYLLARLILIVLAFTTLRSLPFTALETVYWTTFIPHL